MYSNLPKMVQELLPILVLLFAITVVMVRLPKVDVGHSPEFKRRRLLNWLPLGLTYAFLYMGRYNLTVSKNALGDLMTNEDFGLIFAAGTWTYGIAFVLNGPLTDKFGGRLAILVSAVGSAVMNVLMGLVIAVGYTDNLRLIFSVLYAGNMYFQSFGAVAVVKVNSPWFHLRERGLLGGVFGILISLGLYFAYDWGRLIVDNMPTQYVFFIPAALLLFWFMTDLFLVKDSPSQAGFKDFDTGDATFDDKGVTPSVWEVAKRMMRSPAIMTIGAIEFCSGFLRNAIMQWYTIFSKQVGINDTFVPKNWGMLLCCAGILGGVFAGVISDKVFSSRRGPVSAILYAFMILGALAMVVALKTPALGWVMIFMSLSIIGVHGMLSGTASADFGGKKNTGLAVGLIDGLVYLGTGLQALVLGHFLPSGDAAKVVDNWWIWPWILLPVAVIGFVLSLRVWNATPQKAAAH